MRVAVAAIILLLVGCASAPPPVPQFVSLPADIELARADGPQHDLPNLNVSIVRFTSIEAGNNSLYSSASQVRSVETRYLPYVLKRTLNESGFWGDVRVLPAADPSAELTVTGSIKASDGLLLRLDIRAQDATGRVWLERDYSAYASENKYRVDPSYLVDPFQNLHNQIANDLSEALLAMDRAQHAAVLDTAMLNYAIALSPESFSRYLTQDESGVTRVAGLPARDDPLFTRVERLRESEYLFADSVDAHYGSLFTQIGPTYAWWRHYSYELIVGNQDLERKDATRGATRGSWYAMDRIYHTFKESKMNEDALRELTSSFDRETTPIATQIAGQVIELKGTADFQYEEWRRILRELYREETGL